jgi:peptide/nickel transport system ATP-binding protein
MRRIRGARMGMIFQEPMSSLNPVMTVGGQIGESLPTHRGLRGRDASAQVVELLGSVGIPAPQRRAQAYPHQLSGGMKQRAMFAMVLAGEPQLLIADEPTTALDVTIQAQVLDLLRALQRESQTAMLLITHDLGVVAEIAQRLAVMYAGELVEEADCERFFRAPGHPYSHKLFQSLPGMDRRDRSLSVIPGQVPRLDQGFRGCRFASRCKRAWEVCHSQAPQWHRLGPAYRVRCHLYASGAPVSAAGEAAPEQRRAPRRPADEVPAPLLEVRDLKVHFQIRKGILQRIVGQVYAVDGVSLSIAPRQALALVGGPARPRRAGGSRNSTGPPRARCDSTGRS